MRPAHRRTAPMIYTGGWERSEHAIYPCWQRQTHRGYGIPQSGDAHAYYNTPLFIQSFTTRSICPTVYDYRTEVSYRIPYPSTPHGECQYTVSQRGGGVRLCVIGAILVWNCKAARGIVWRQDTKGTPKSTYTTPLANRAREIRKRKATCRRGSDPIYTS